MTERADAIVIGAGHNGLTSAAYLARSGRDVLVLEAGPRAGGMAAPIEFGDGFRAPGLAQFVFPVAADIRRDLGLDGHGYAPERGVTTTSLGADGDHVVIGERTIDGQDLPTEDRDAYPAFLARYQSFVEAMRPLMENAPPRLKGMPFADKKVLAALGWKLRGGLGREAMYEFLRVVAINIYDVLNEVFSDDRLKGAIAAEAVMGSSMGPRTPGTVLTWLQWLGGMRNGRLSLASGSETGLVPALIRSVEGAGATIRFDAAVERIRVDNDRAIGVTLAGGEQLDADIVVSGADPRRTLGTLVGAPNLDAMFAHRVSQIRGSGTVAKLLLGLDKAPAFNGLDEAGLASRLLVAPSAPYVERAFNPSKYGEYPEHPVLDIAIPTLVNPALAPEGHHVMSVNVAYVPAALKDDSESARNAFVRRLVAQLDDFAPGLADQVVASELLTPSDIEARWGVSGGHWHHGELSIHQSFMMRPLYGAARYSTPIDGLYLSSAGCHPGGGITAQPGRLAARCILESGDDA